MEHDFVGVENGKYVDGRTMPLSAVEAVAYAHPIGWSDGREAHGAAQASAMALLRCRLSVHKITPLH